MDPATGFIEKLPDYAIKAVGRQLGYMIFYRNNIAELREQIKHLNGKQEAVQHSIEEGRRNGARIETQVEIG